MHEMMDRLDVDAGRLVRLDQGEAYAEARIRCLDCRETETCLRWLEAFDDFAGRPEFCPNIELFDACAPAAERRR
jgi:hypothetical protein